MSRMYRPASAAQVMTAFAVLVILLVTYVVHLSESWTGADAARGGCPEGYVSVPTTQVGVVGTKNVVLYGSQCVVKP